MGGVALGNLWDTHPRLACGLQTAASIVMAALFIGSLVQRNWGYVAVVGVFLVLEVSSLLVFTREAKGRGWSRSSW